MTQTSAPVSVDWSNLLQQLLDKESLSQTQAAQVAQIAAAEASQLAQ